jgi:hypothetical protein
MGHQCNSLVCISPCAAKKCFFTNATMHTLTSLVKIFSSGLLEHHFVPNHVFGRFGIGTAAPHGFEKTSSRQAST